MKYSSAFGTPTYQRWTENIFKYWTENICQHLAFHLNSVGQNLFWLLDRKCLALFGCPTYQHWTENIFNYWTGIICQHLAGKLISIGEEMWVSIGQETYLITRQEIFVSIFISFYFIFRSESSSTSRKIKLVIKKFQNSKIILDPLR